MKIVIAFVILCSSAMAQAAISDRYCDIGIPEVSNIFLDYSIRNKTLEILINKGYRPYHVTYASQVTSGLMLNWGFYNRKTIFGNYKREYHGTIISKENGRQIMLGTEKGSSMESVLRGLPSCRIY